MTPLLSVVVPTRNRQAYVLQAIRTVLAELPDAELVVCDNSDEDRLRGDITNYVATGRVKYFYTSETLGVSENFERALAAASGDYITLLGDDDTIGPRLRDIAQWAKQQGVDAVNWRSESRVLHYFWPGVRLPHWGASVGGALYLSAFTGKTAPVDPKAGILDALSHLGGGPRLLPRPYLGLVSRDVVERTRARWGRVFGSISPDVYAGTLIALEARRQVVIDYPFVLPGACPSSNSVLHAERPASSLDGQEHLRRSGSVEWDERVPAFYSHITVWAVALLDVARAAGIAIPARAYPALYATCLLKAWPQRAAILRAMRAYMRDHGGATTYALTGLCLLEAIALRTRQIAVVLWRRLPGGARYRFAGLDDTDAAYRRLVQHLAMRKIEPELPVLP
jgi:hypothetical protein